MSVNNIKQGIYSGPGRIGIPLLIALFFLVAIAAQAQLSPGNWKTDLSRKSIKLSALRSGGPPKDGIPAIHDPEFVSPKEAAKWVSAKEPVVVVEYADEVRAYPLQILIWHELVNDKIGDLPILVSFCPLCNIAITFDRRIDGKVHNFGVSGMLRNNCLVMYDWQTDSLWQQIPREAIVGTLTGKQLDIVSSQVVPFETFMENFPDGKVLSRETGHERPYGHSPYIGYEFGNRTMFPVGLAKPMPVAPLERLVTISVGGKSKAYPFKLLRRRHVTEGRTKKNHFVIFFDPTAVTPMDAIRIADSRKVGAVGVFSPELDGKRLRFRHKGDKIVDKTTGSTWNLLGMATDGPLAGKRLEPIDHGVYYAFAWLVFNPDTQVIGVTGGEQDPFSQRLAQTSRPGVLGGPRGSSFPGSQLPASQP